MKDSNKLRKIQHIEICAQQDVESKDRFTGFSEFHFIPEALPNLDFEDICTEQIFLGKTFNYPLLITGMTGGVNEGARINYNLAAAASHFNIPMGVGSQRIALEDKKYAKIFSVKDRFPNLFLIANLGAAQLTKANAVDLCQQAVDMIQADAFAIHLNVVQECVQEEGDRKFKGLLDQIHRITEALSVPVMVKEVGCGIAPATAKKLTDAGVKALDVGGRGGTSWPYIEGLRSSSEKVKQLADSFRNWGIPTAFSLQAIRASEPHLPLIATGGVRDGLVVAKALALGATMVGVGLPLMRAALISQEAVYRELEVFFEGLKISMIATESPTTSHLKNKLVRGIPYGSYRED